MRLWDGDYRSRHNRLEWPGFCGMTHPDTVVSPNNEMFIRFKSNNREVSTGFEIRIEEGWFFQNDLKFFNNALYISSCFIKILIYSLFCFKFLTVEELLHPMEPFCLLNIHKTIQTTRIVSGSSDSLKKNELCWNSWHSIWNMLIVAGK